jgi:type II secretory pathway predicted ATPase ExeA
MYALFADLMTDKKAQILSKLEFRERQLMELISSKNKPVVLFIDKA